ncbi:MAG: hypothetical protein ACJAZT_002097, partial [Gammaproteobacteria bacterium]
RWMLLKENLCRIVTCISQNTKWIEEGLNNTMMTVTNIYDGL